MARTIRACIADEAIAKVMQFFDGTLSQTLHEILQNARRSGATNVTIAHDDGKNRITVRDDGRGISDPRALLAFGRSDWPEELRQESPAGMGVFSLARRSPRIRSRIAGGRAWTLQLSQDHFIGRAPAVVENDNDWTPAHGTEVAFSTLPTDNAWIPSVIAEAVRHYPIPATFNGRKPEQIDFLKDAIRVETWRGMRIGVFSSTSTTWATPSINFHGLAVQCRDLPQVHALPAADADAPRAWWTMGNVVDCPDLELTLPTRTAIVRTPFTDELIAEATAVIYRAINAAGLAPRLGYETRTKASAAAIPLPPDPKCLIPWRPKMARDAKHLQAARHPDLQHAILVDDDRLDAAESQTLAWAARETGTLGRYWETEPALAGYRWYDALPRITGLNIHVTDAGRTETSTRKTRQDYAPTIRRRVEHIELEVLVERLGSDRVETIRIPTSMALLSPEATGTSDDSPDFVVAATDELDTAALQTALVDAYFEPAFDCSADSLDTQLRDYRRTITYLVTELLDSAEAAAEHEVRDLVETCILPNICTEWNMDIEIRAGVLAAVRRL